MLDSNWYNNQHLCSTNKIIQNFHLCMNDIKKA